MQQNCYWQAENGNKQLLYTLFCCFFGNLQIYFNNFFDLPTLLYSFAANCTFRF
jgi:hypothetical protein